MAAESEADKLRREVDRMQRQLEHLGRQLAEARTEAVRARKFLRDSYMGAILGGLCVRWDWGHTSAQRVAEYAELLCVAVMRQRERWECGISVNQPGSIPETFVPLPPPAAPAQKGVT